MKSSSDSILERIQDDKKQDLFETSHLHADLKGHTLRGGFATLGAQGFGFLLSIGSIAILARLLTPADFGLVAMVTALTGILALFKDAGLSMATVQQDTVTHEQVSTLFWINVALCLIFTLAIAALAPVVAWFYDEPKLYWITLAVASLFIFDGLAVQHQALLRRQMRFGTLARIQIISSSLSVAAAIAAAVIGAGYWALLVQVAVSQITGMGLSWAYCRWIPGRPRRGVGTRAMLKFGVYLTGFNFINYFARNTDNILIGKVWGASELGLYSRAYTLLTLPLQQINAPISSVVIPALSRLQDDPIAFRDFFRKILTATSFLTFPLILWLIICRKEIMLLILGPQWESAAPIFGALAFSAFCQPIGNITGALYISLGRTKRMFQWGIIGSVWLIVAFIIGIPYGPYGVALAYSIAVITRFIPLVIFAKSGTPVTMQDFFDGTKNSIFATLAASVAGIIVYDYSITRNSEFLTMIWVGFSISLTFIPFAIKINILKAVRYFSEKNKKDL